MVEVITHRWRDISLQRWTDIEFWLLINQNRIFIKTQHWIDINLQH